MTEAQLTNIQQIRSYALGGNAKVTLVSARTKTRYTYEVTLKKGSDDFFFVSLLTGPENEGDYQPFGTVRRRGANEWVFRLNWSAESMQRAPSVTGFEWFVRQINRPQGEISKQVEVWTSGHCANCGRTLTTPESVAIGMGPKCRARIGARLD